MNEFRLDRILEKNEITQLHELLVPKFKNNYPNFELWLEKAQKEIAEGSRIAIGIWKEKLIATSIIKLTASNTAELKSFFVDDDFRQNGYGNTLYEETENQCQKAGVTRIITDTYVDNVSMIEFLISKGFLFAGKEDLYGNGKDSYILSKSLKPEYLGDPYDWEELGEWYLQAKLNAVKIENHPTVNNRFFDKHMRLTVGDYSLEALVEIKDEKVDMDELEILDKNCFESDYNLGIFVARDYTTRAKKYAKKHGLIIFDAEDISKILGKKPLEFKEGPIGGMVVSIRHQYLKRLHEKKLPYYYAKGGPFGKFLKKGHYIIFYTTDPIKNITTIGEVDSVIIDSPIKIWNSINKKAIFTEEEFFRFASIKQKILAIKLSEIWEIPSIEGSELDSLIPKKDRSGSYIDVKKIDIFLKGRKKVKIKKI